METPAAGGLSQPEAQQRLRIHGPNELPPPPRRGIGRIVLSVLSEPMFLLLVTAAGVYFIIGDPHESLLLAAFAVMSVGLVVVQETRSERALEALRALAAPTASVLRDGLPRRIPAREVVPGDLLLAGEGERIAADGWILRADDLAIDEALLTGESVPVSKRARRAADTGELPAPGGEDQAGAYSGTLVVRGHARMLVERTGPASAAGRIGLSLATISSEPTLLQRSVGRLVRLFGAVAALVSLAMVLGYGLLRGDWAQGVLSGIALAMAMLPEEFPMALAVFLALGAWRMARVNVLVRRPAMVETLGAATVLCVDKTGTLTENRMRVRVLASIQAEVELHGTESELPETVHRLLEYALLASKRHAHDPMDSAVGDLAAQTLASTEHLHAQWPLEREYGLSAQLLAISRIWQREDGGRELASKGAPEAVLELCRIGGDAAGTILKQVHALAARGLRVLAVAGGQAPAGALPGDPRALAWRFEGLIGFADPLRASAPRAVERARASGIVVAMITGDYPSTALAIAAQAGIDTRAGALSGPELDALDEPALQAALRRVRVYARIRPEQKLRLVQAMKANGEVVAMTGDGVNDAPALKAAHIGLAMGGRGTDVAREAAGIVLLDDDFGHIVDGIRLGRRIFENLRKVLVYITAIHVPVAALALAPLLLGLPPMILPLHVVLIEMVVDPICSIAFEDQPEREGLMRAGPRRQNEPLIGIPQLAVGVLLGALIFAGCFALYAGMLAQGHGEAQARTLAFVALTVCNLMLVRVLASEGPVLRSLRQHGHKPFWIIAGAVTLVVAACVLVPGLAALFGFASPGPAALATTVVGSVLAMALIDGVKCLPAVRRGLEVRARESRQQRPSVSS